MLRSNSVELRPIIVVNNHNIAEWEMVAQDHVNRLGLQGFMNEQLSERLRARESMYDPSIRPEEAPATWISIRAFQLARYADIDDMLELDEKAKKAEKTVINDHLEKLFSLAVQRSQEVKTNVLAFAQWLVNSVSTENLLHVFGNLPYDDFIVG